MHFNHFIAIIFLSLMSLCTCLQAEESKTQNSELTPVGVWKTIDDETKQPKALVEIFEKEGKFFGKIIKTFSKPGDITECSKCSGDKKNKPIVGLEILWKLKKEGSEFTDGYILDPKNGTTYDASIKVLENGEKLKVRGFLGWSVLGRTQYWLKSSEGASAAKTSDVEKSEEKK